MCGDGAALPPAVAANGPGAANGGSSVIRTVWTTLPVAGDVHTACCVAIGAPISGAEFWACPGKRMRGGGDAAGAGDVTGRSRTGMPGWLGATEMLGWLGGATEILRCAGCGPGEAICGDRHGPSCAGSTGA